MHTALFHDFYHLYYGKLNRCVFNHSPGHDCIFIKKKEGPKLPVLKVYESRLCPVQKIITRYKSTFFRFHDARQVGISKGEGGRKRGIAAAGRVWQQQGGYGLVGHVPRYRMVRFGGHPTEVEGAGGDTVKNIS